MKKVLLLCMPFATTCHPAIGISLLKARLAEQGIACDIRYLNLLFAETMGRDPYERLGGCQGDNTLLREWLFARHYFGDRLPDRKAYATYLRGLYGGDELPAGPLEELLGLERLVPPFLERCLRSVAWEEYDIVGFTTMFEQNMVALCLAREVKARYPEKIVVFGGANCEGELGMALHRNFPEIDYICSGEADLSFPELVRRIESGIGVEDLPGIVYREGTESRATSGTAYVADLDLLPYPDYGDYFDQLKMTSPAFQVPPRNYGIPLGLPMESSRGCWWGEKSQCRFCSLNRGTIAYRSKSQKRVLKELSELSRRYGTDEIFMVDNILNMEFFQELMPTLAKGPLRLQMFYEVKSNLNREQVAQLKAAGVTCVQPGIESLNSHVLKLMRKGVTALENIRLLKHCARFGVYPGWSVITGFPGEKAEDYREMTDLIAKLVHLPPPNGNARFSLQRFSPYFAHPEQAGIERVRPDAVYRFIYPFSDAEIADLAYYFEFDYQDEVRPPDSEGALAQAIGFWKESYEANGTLSVTETGGDALVITDTRLNAVVRRLVLEGPQREIYGYCDEIRSFGEILDHLQFRYSELPVRPRDVRDFLYDLVACNVMAQEADKYLSLAIGGDAV